ncbi:MAG: hypothetical protein G01um10145_718 [Microgenomates group bacterium Gr01-1014_5]|nr:MAG: hypothetical protein G01um10145_718 [Microgenomates group bacterium Gr01-1014_5]
MFKLFSIVEEKESPINGKIQIVRDLQGARIIVGGVSQSGWLVKSIWNKALKKISNLQSPVSNVLILGLGGGSAAELVQKYWPEAKITGVDIDPLMVEMGKKHLQLASVNINVVIADAWEWVETAKGKKGVKYDLVLVDLFNGSKIPEKFYREKFIRSIQKILAPGGVATFNHLYSFIEKETAHKLQKKLRNIFITVNTVLPEANIIFLCFSK